MVKSIRQIEIALGSGVKTPTASEVKNKSVVRKSIVAATDIEKGEEFTESSLTIKRPGTGLAPYRYWELIGTKAKRDFKAGELIFE